jgi:nitrite reductase/ring-hydroxylating ferredoxin subunit
VSATETSTRQRHRVAPIEEIPDRGGVLLDLGGREIGIFKCDGKLYAYENRCVHRGGPVCSGTILGKTELELNQRGEVLREYLDDDQMRLICPWHGWEYDLATGEVAHDRRFRLRSYDVEVVEGVVYVEA